MLTSKKGISARQLHRYMGFGSYGTAWYMAHRIRAALSDQPVAQLGGIVEVDETFVGGLAKNKHIDKRGGGHGTGGTGSGKTPIIGAVSRKGNAVCRVIDNVRRSTLEAFVNEAVSHKVSLICTDQWVGYKHLGETYPHGVIDHAKGEYVVGAIHTNTIEGFWSIFKRGVVGTFHKVSRKYMPLYIAEFQFRYNNRMNPDIFGTAIADAEVIRMIAVEEHLVCRSRTLLRFGSARAQIQGQRWLALRLWAGWRASPRRFCRRT
jgi:hypothetical protein